MAVQHYDKRIQERMVTLKAPKEQMLWGQMGENG